MPPDVTADIARRERVLARLLFVASVAALVAFAQPAFAALPVTSSPELKLARTIRTSPFVGSSISIKDGEGSAYVPRDNSLWLADDNGRAVYEVNPTTGALKQKIATAAFEAAPKFGGGSPAGTNRDRDLESMAYDEATDTLYAFSGRCCQSSVLPTAFRLTRTGGTFKVESYQPLATGAGLHRRGLEQGRREDLRRWRRTDPLLQLRDEHRELDVPCHRSHGDPRHDASPQPAPTCTS